MRERGRILWLRIARRVQRAGRQPGRSLGRLFGRRLLLCPTTLFGDRGILSIEVIEVEVEVEIKAGVFLFVGFRLRCRRALLATSIEVLGVILTPEIRLGE